MGGYPGPHWLPARVEMTDIAAPRGGSTGLSIAVEPPRLRLRRRHWHWTTPGRVRGGAPAAVVLAMAVATLTASLFGRLHGEFGAIGQTDESEATATTSLYFYLTDMDGSGADVLLVGSDATLTTADQTDNRYYTDLYASDRSNASKYLDQAVVAETGNAGAEQQLNAVAARLGQYEALIADAELLSQQAHDAAGKPSSTVSADYNQATRLMQSDILPTVRNLTSSSESGLNASYSAGKTNAISGVIWAVVLGVLLVAVLAALQVLLAIRFRRLVNPALALVTLLAIAFTAVTSTRFYAEYTHAHVARFDSFSSIQALSMAKAVSNDANADESRFIVDPIHTAQYQQAYLDKSQQIVNVGNNVTYAQYLPLLNADIAAYQRNNSDIRFGGFLGQEFRNITFPGERQAAVNSLLTFRVYETDDRILRAMTNTNLAQAVGYDMNVAPNDSDGAFNAYANALQSDININSAAFTQAVADGQSNAEGGSLAVEALSALVIISLVYVGVRSRLAEYRAIR
jgi:hypothetical protein